MSTCMRISAILAGTLVLVVQAAAQTYKCQTKEGKTIYSDRPCPGQPVTVRPPAQGGSASSGAQSDSEKECNRTGSKEACGRHSLEIGQKVWKQQCDSGMKEACTLLEKSRSSGSLGQAINEHAVEQCNRGDRSACEAAYCMEDRSSPQCLAKMGRASGSNWYESSSRERMRDGRTAVDIQCREKSPYGNYRFTPRIFCAAHNATCTHNQGSKTTFNTLDEAASDACERALAEDRRLNRNAGGR